MTTKESPVQTPVVDKATREHIASEYGKLMEGRLDATKIQAAKKMIIDTTTAYPAVGSIASVVIWFDLKCDITGSESYSGKAWGGGTPGGGWLGGNVYTDNLPLLLSNTTSASFISAVIPAGYTTFLFHDSEGTLLGSFQAGAVSTVEGGGHGSGSFA